MKTGLITAILGASLAVQAAELTVQCGVPPLAAVVNTVGGDRVLVRSMMDGSQDPCVYSPSPKTVASARDADIFFTAGMPFENAVAKKLLAMNPALTVVDTSVGVTIPGDPHIWMSLPVLAKMAEDIRQALSRADPAGAAFYQENLETFRRKLSGQHEDLKRKLQPFQGVTFYVYHPILGHFAEEYGLIQQTVELEGKSPAPQQLLGLIRRARAENVRVVFVQPQFSDKSARILAERIGGQVVPVNPLAEDTVAVIEQAAERIAQAYAPRQKP
jgi:zinc transport system substrate-binding protein